VRTVRFLIPICCSCAVVLLSAAEPPVWNTKPIASWSEQDARQILDESPWAKTVLAGIARRPTEAERRDGGNMGQPHGVGYDGIDDRMFRPEVLGNPFGLNPYPPPPDPMIHVLVRWESARPVRAAESKTHENGPPALLDEGYTIAVYGVPGRPRKGSPKHLGAPFKELAALKRIGKKDVKPVSVEVFQLARGVVLVYRFPLSAEISTRDTAVEFSALIGRLQVSQVFLLDAMQFQGALEL
jgi:hypothetical protein